MLKQILTLIIWMLLFAAVSVLVLAGINSTFGTEIGLKIGGYRHELPSDFFTSAGISLVLVCFAGLFALISNMPFVFGKFRAAPLRTGVGILAGSLVLTATGYLAVMQLAGGPLTFAVERGDHSAVVEILGNSTYAQRALDEQLYQALAKGYYEIAQTLIDHGADVNNKSGEFSSPLLISSALYFDVKATTFLLNHDADPNQVDSMGRTPLLIAISYRAARSSKTDKDAALATVKELLHAGADPAIAANNGDTPLSIADRRKYQAIIQQLQP